MIWPFENDTSATERKIARDSFRANKTRNIIAVIAIALTAILFTSLFTLGAGMLESTNRANMILSGGDGHARIIDMNQSEFDTISRHSLIDEIAYTRKLADSVNNKALSKRDVQLWYYDDLALKYYFVEPTSGHKPEAENEFIADTTTLALLGVPQAVGAEVTLDLTVHGQQITRNFILAGWWQSYPGVHYGTIVTSQAYVEAHVEELTDTFQQDYAKTGTITAIVKFDSAQNVKEDLTTVVDESGYSMDVTAQNYINAGVNPIYLSTEASNRVGTIMALICALLLFLFAGYLIIYNIFQISILRDLHFYGLLKTIGTTGRQINSIIRKQALKLSLIGIPIGLCGGFIIGKVLLPLLMEQTSFSGYATTVSLNPFIFIAAAIFVLATVRISTRKPVRMAAKVSPIEAVRYADANDIPRRKKKRISRSNNIQRYMAWSNLDRNKKRTVMTVLSLSLSILLTNTVFTFSNSVNPEYAIKNLINSDFYIGQSNLLNYYEVSEETALSESFIQAVEKQNGFEEGGREYGCSAVYKSGTTKQTVNAQEGGNFSTHIYGLDPFLFSNLQLVDGELDIEKLKSGEYILEGAYVSTRGVMDEDSLNHSVGDKVKVDCNGNIREFTVLGHVVANEANTYDWVGSCFFLTSDVYKGFTGNTYPMTYNFNVSQNQKSDMDMFLKQYTSDVEPDMTYEAESTIMAGVTDIQKTVVSVGGAMSFIIGLIGVLNFVNTTLTSIFTRRREFAVLQSVGMTVRQLIKMLCLEGSYYAVVSIMISVPLCLISSLIIVRPICEKIWFLAFKMNFLPLVILSLFLLLIGIMTPYVSYRMMNKQSVVERLKDSE